jgi:hypothetical protein
MAKVLIKTSPKTGDPVVANEQTVLTHGKGPIETNLDLRDRIYELMKGNDLKPDDRAAIYGNLTSILGQDKAQKLMQHAYIFNTIPEYQKLPYEDKIKQLYTRGSNDPAVQEILTRTNNLGYGTGAGFRTSFSSMAQQMAGRTSTETGQASPKLAKKIMLKVSR